MYIQITYLRALCITVLCEPSNALTISSNRNQFLFSNVNLSYSSDSSRTVIGQLRGLNYTEYSPLDFNIQAWLQGFMVKFHGSDLFSLSQVSGEISKQRNIQI